MSDEIKKPFDLGPILPMFGAGIDLGERLGAMDSRLKQLETGQTRLEIKIDVVEAKLTAKIEAVEAKLTDKIEAVEAKLTDKIEAVDAKLTAKIEAVEAKLTDKIEAVDGRVDKCLVAINRMDERMKSLNDRVNFLAEGRKTDHNLLLGILAAVIAGFILQFFLK